MKTPIILTIGAVLVLSSCTKTRTCTCKDASGKEVSKITKTSNDKSSIKSFEDACRSKKTTSTTSGSSGSTSTSIPCELS